MDYNKIEEKALKAVGKRSAWSRGVCEYVKELCENLRENLDLDGALEQSINDARVGEIPVVIHRKNRKDWKVTMRLEDFTRLWNNQIQWPRAHTQADAIEDGRWF